MVEETLSKLETNGMKYDAILVDEGQDFTNGMIEVVLALLNDETNNLTIALDEGQNIYGRDLSWQREGERAPVKIESVSKVYRNTVEIRDFAQRFISKTVGKHEEMGSTYCDVHGPAPELKRFGVLRGDYRFCCRHNQDLQRAGGIPFIGDGHSLCQKIIERR